MIRFRGSAAWVLALVGILGLIWVWSIATGERRVDAPVDAPVDDALGQDFGAATAARESPRESSDAGGRRVVEDRELRSEQQSELRVRVIDAAEAGLAFVEIEALRLARTDGGWPIAARNPVLRATTDRDGRATLPVTRGQWLVRANGNRKLPRKTSVSAVHQCHVGSNRVTLALEDSRASIKLDLQSPDGAPMPGYHVRVHRIDDESRLRTHGPPAPAAKRPFLEVDGCTRRPLDRYRLLQAASCFSCHAGAGATRAPTAPSKVRSRNVVASATSDAAGQVRFSNLPAGRYVVESRKAEYDGHLWLPGDDGLVIALGAGEAHHAVYRILVAQQWSVELPSSVGHAVIVHEPTSMSSIDERTMRSWSRMQGSRFDAILRSRSKVVTPVYNWVSNFRPIDSVPAGAKRMHTSHLLPGSWRTQLRFGHDSEMVTPEPVTTKIGPFDRVPWRPRLAKSPHAASGRFVAVDGRPVQGVFVVARDLRGRFLKSAHCSNAGTYLLRGLPAGPLWLCWHRRWPHGDIAPIVRTDLAHDCQRFPGPALDQLHHIVTR